MGRPPNRAPAHGGDPSRKPPAPAATPSGQQVVSHLLRCGCRAGAVLPMPNAADLSRLRRRNARREMSWVRPCVDAGSHGSSYRKRGTAGCSTTISNSYPYALELNRFRNIDSTAISSGPSISF